MPSKPRFLPHLEQVYPKSQRSARAWEAARAIMANFARHRAQRHRRYVPRNIVGNAPMVNPCLLFPCQYSDERLLRSPYPSIRLQLHARSFIIQRPPTLCRWNADAIYGTKLPVGPQFHCGRVACHHHPLHYSYRLSSSNPFFIIYVDQGGGHCAPATIIPFATRAMARRLLWLPKSFTKKPPGFRKPGGSGHDIM